MTRPLTQPFDEPQDEPVLPMCRPTVDRIQSVLDGEQTADALDADPHAIACPVCRERIRAARLLLIALAEYPAPAASPDLTNTIVAGVRADRRMRMRRRVFAAVGGCAVAAAVLIGVWAWWTSTHSQSQDVPPIEMVDRTPPSSQPGPVPESKPLRIDTTLAKAGEAFENSARPITEPAEAAPKMFATLTDGLLKPSALPARPDLEPARKSLAEIPVAAKTGLEPVTDTAQKAFSRLMHDVGAIQPSGKPK